MGRPEGLPALWGEDMKELEIFNAQQKLAARLQLMPGYLKFLAIQNLAPGLELLLFNLNCPGHPQHQSTLSVRR